MHRTKKMTVVTTGLALLMAAGMSSAMASNNNPRPGKVTICHRTGSDKNPYVKITISENARHAHIGPEAHPPKNGRVDQTPMRMGSARRARHPTPTRRTPTATRTATPRAALATRRRASTAS